MAQPKRTPTTVYLDPRLARAAKVKAALADKSLSDLVGESLAKALREDADDVELVRKRRKESRRSYEDFLAALKKDGLL